MSKTLTARGPDFTNCGNPVDWADQAPINEQFPQAIANAIATPGIDIELCRWSKDDPLVSEYIKSWNAQIKAIRVETATMNYDGLKRVISRRIDKGDGFTKCYIRFDRQRLKAVAA